MVIFDTENKRKSDIGLLYLNLLDLDYLSGKFKLEKIMSFIPKEKRDIILNKLMRAAGDEWSEEFSSLVCIPIRDKQIELLDIIKKEIQKGNLFTREQLTNLSEKDIDDGLNDAQKDYPMSVNKLYKLRSYILASQILEDKKRVCLVLDKWDKDNLYDVYTYKMILDRLSFIGVTHKIHESDYFKEDAKELLKH